MKKGFNPEVSRIELHPEQAVLECRAYNFSYKDGAYHINSSNVTGWCYSDVVGDKAQVADYGGLSHKCWEAWDSSSASS